jgi:membrane protein
MRSYARIAVRAARRYLADGMADRAPSLAYYGMLSLFPALLIATSVMRLVGVSESPGDIAEYVEERGASGALSGAVEDILATARAAPAPGVGVIGFVGVVALIYGASRAFTAAGRALDAIGGRLPRPRSLKRRAQDIGWTLALLALGMVAVVLLAVSGRVLEDLLGLVGLSGVAVTIWSIARWPAAIALALLAFAVVQWAAPTGSRPRFRFITPGAVVAVALWVAATIGFGIYVGYVATYNATYGAFAGAIILLLWIWLGSAALLYGAEVDAVLREPARE